MNRTFHCTFLTYHDDSNKRRKEVVYAVKNCRRIRDGNYAGRDGREVMVEVSRLRRERMYAYLEGAILVPVPTSGSGVDKPGDDLWSSWDLARMLAAEYGAQAQQLLRRHMAIQKSSSYSGPRNLRRHVESIELSGPIPRGPVVLIDDVVATGSTMCACAEIVFAAQPQAQVKGLAVAYVAGKAGGERLHDFAARQYEWNSLDGRPRNFLLSVSPLDKH